MEPAEDITKAIYCSIEFEPPEMQTVVAVRGRACMLIVIAMLVLVIASTGRILLDIREVNNLTSVSSSQHYFGVRAGLLPAAQFILLDKVGTCAEIAEAVVTIAVSCRGSNDRIVVEIVLVVLLEPILPPRRAGSWRHMEPDCPTREARLAAIYMMIAIKVIKDRAVNRARDRSRRA